MGSGRSVLVLLQPAWPPRGPEFRSDAAPPRLVANVPVNGSFAVVRPRCCELLFCTGLFKVARPRFDDMLSATHLRASTHATFGETVCCTDSFKFTHPDLVAHCFASSCLYLRSSLMTVCFALVCVQVRTPRFVAHMFCSTLFRFGRNYAF